jgi:hypothetical protein
VWLEGSGQLKKSTSSGTRTGDLPACRIVAQPTTLPRAPLLKLIYKDIFQNIKSLRSQNLAPHFWMLKNVISLLLLAGRYGVWVFFLCFISRWCFFFLFSCVLHYDLWARCVSVFFIVLCYMPFFLLFL